MPITRTCRISGKEFVITDREIAFLESIAPTIAWKKYPLWLPTLCPEERMRRRLSWRNSFSLYKGKCIISGKDIVTSYNPDFWYIGVDQRTWWTEIECLEYGIIYSEDQTFFSQYNRLIQKTPLPCLSNSYDINENSEYVNGTINIKDSYLIFNSFNSQNCEYSETVNTSEHIFDSSYVFDSSYCYDCIGINRCYQCIAVEESEDCQESLFLYDCHWCSFCILSYWLENQKYCIKNKQVTEEEYQSFLGSMRSQDGTLKFEVWKNTFEDMKQNINKGDHIIWSEDCSGRFIKYSKNVENGKNLTGVEDTMNTWQMNYVTRCYDCFSWGWGSVWSPGAENCYECHGVWSSAYGLIGCWWVWENTRNMYYCYSCIWCQNCFGCVGLRNKSYCILNIQYTKDEYERLINQIIEKMTSDQEWGEYPPSSMSTFGYNESYAMLEFPLTEDEARIRNYKWKSEVISYGPSPIQIIPASRLPENIWDIPDDILSWALECVVSGKYYTITRPELEFYRKHHLPIPRKHYDVRRKERFERRSR
jgi:hypothetical protein